jgi:homoserine O-succinyltransferase
LSSLSDLDFPAKGAKARRPPAIVRARDKEAPGAIEIGLVNNMPDGALRATERQFATLLAAAAKGRRVRLRRFALPEVERGREAAAHVAANYGGLAELESARLDGLIVTGKEPRSPSLSAEPYWKSFTRVVDWAARNTVSTIWSCLAAHAAVLHLDGIERRPVGAKLVGVFECCATLSHALTDGLALPLRVPHSRFNTLRAEDLAAHGYRVLTRSPQAGVDMFVKQEESLFLFFQGHPEYDLDSLAREHRRDVGRYLRGQSADYPPVPASYFDEATTRALARFEARARARRDPALLDDFPVDLRVRPALAQNWRASAIPIYRNWLGHLAAARTGAARL